MRLRASQQRRSVGNVRSNSSRVSGAFTTGSSWAKTHGGSFACRVTSPVVGGGDEETSETDAGDVSVSRDGEDVHVTARDGQFEGRFGKSAELLENFPDDVPIPEGVTIVDAMTSREPGAESTMVSIQSGVRPMRS